ncbi:hypothetical protein KCP70_14250 [Salmonella enterica subsp. enterica]|nr:hypothetical protein KCP70_14250 [Salmonella enterica subsp. enterica]
MVIRNIDWVVIFAAGTPSGFSGRPAKTGFHPSSGRPCGIAAAVPGQSAVQIGAKPPTPSRIAAIAQLTTSAATSTDADLDGFPAVY